MNIKNKILAILVLSIIVYAGGGFILYNLYTSPATPNDRFELFTYTSGEQTSTVKIQPFVESAKDKRNRRRGQNSISMPVISSDMGIMNELKPSFDGFESGIASNGGRYSTSGKGRDYNMSSTNPGGVGLLAFGGTSKSGNHLGGESSNGGGSLVLGTSAATTPMGVPFSGNNGWALVDPEPNTLTPENQIVPVGDGIVPLALLALLYGAVVWIRRKL